MPGSVSNAVASVVLPENLALGFRRVRELAVQSVTYQDGRQQVAKLAETSRKVWMLDYRLPGVRVAALRTFVEANAEKAMIFYDAEERVEEGATPLYDPTGAAAGPGKYTVRFDVGVGFRTSAEIARGTSAVRLVEIT